MNIFKKRKLSKAIEERKCELPFVRIKRIVGSTYYLRGDVDIIKTDHLNINFIGMKREPKVGDGFYVSENIIDGLRENLYSYNFSTRIGKVYARKPHDFLIDPKEFMIFEYANGKTILLEQWYG